MSVYKNISEQNQKNKQTEKSIKKKNGSPVVMTDNPLHLISR